VEENFLDRPLVLSVAIQQFFFRQRAQEVSRGLKISLQMLKDETVVRQQSDILNRVRRVLAFAGFIDSLRHA
jgi:hypothetical protein